MSLPIDNLPFDSLQEQGLEEFLLRGNRQIRQLLQELIDKRALISVHLIPAGLSFLSTILTLSEDEEWLFLDASQNETIHRHCLQAERLLCITQLNKIRIQFRLDNGTEVPVEGHLTFAAPIPEEVLRLQRRDAFRLQVPLSHNLKCILPAREHKEGQEDQKKSIEVPVIDISAGGLSIEIPASKITPTVGDHINGCQLKLPGDLIGLDLEIRNHGRRIQSNGKEVLRLGCSFVSIHTQAANQIQRYIYQAEREIRANEVGC
ncbi:MAG: flagellar brake protein [Azoarcus sp.]|jgi:c-di-GMP-binding flagellar brake protein YcgR|nr:flagellar brake protein [Azoarcus sp.]